jgi:NUDIX domain
LKLVGAETNPEPKKRSAKVMIVNELDQILILTRSALEDTRQGEPDLPGGKFDEGEKDPLKVLLRETDKELPGTELYNITPLTPPGGIDKTDEIGDRTVTHVYGSNARFPEQGIILSDEHEAFSLIHRSLLPHIRLPRKYRDVGEAAGLALGRLVEFAQSGDGEQLEESYPYLQLVASS